MTEDEKISAFESHFRDRQLAIAEFLSNRFEQGDVADPLSQSAFAILSIVTSYFETIEQFYRGQSSRGNEREFFAGGFRRVYTPGVVSDDDVTRLYKFMRCGMYHSSMPTDRCGLSRHLSHAFKNENNVVIINPAKLVADLQSHFNSYCINLRDPTDGSMRGRMIAMFDMLATQAQTSPELASQVQTTTTAPPWQY